MLDGTIDWYESYNRGLRQAPEPLAKTALRHRMSISRHDGRAERLQPPVRVIQLTTRPWRGDSRHQVRATRRIYSQPALLTCRTMSFGMGTTVGRVVAMSTSMQSGTWS